MKNAMGAFKTKDGVKNLSLRLGVSCVFSSDLAEVAELFGELQDARHIADYDVADTSATVGLNWALDCVQKATRTFAAWARVKSTDEAKLFLANLIFDKKWAK